MWLLIEDGWPPSVKFYMCNEKVFFTNWLLAIYKGIRWAEIEKIQKFWKCKNEIFNDVIVIEKEMLYMGNKGTTYLKSPTFHMKGVIQL